MKTRSIPWLWMPWLFASPGHQQPWLTTMQDKHILVFHEEEFQLPVPSTLYAVSLKTLKIHWTMKLDVLWSIGVSFDGHSLVKSNLINCAAGQTKWASIRDSVLNNNHCAAELTKLANVGPNSKQQITEIYVIMILTYCLPGRFCRDF